MEQLNEFERKYNSGRSNFLLVTILSVVNIVITVAKIDLYFPFSAFVPYLVYDFGAYLKGPYMVMSIAILLIMLLLSVVCYIFSKNKHGFIIAALVLFSIDTVVLIIYIINYFDARLLIDVAFHGWVIYSLIMAVTAIKPLEMQKETGKEIKPEENVG